MYTASDTGSGRYSKGDTGLVKPRRGFLGWEMKAYFAGANRRRELIRVGRDCKLRNLEDRACSGVDSRVDRTGEN